MSNGDSFLKELYGEVDKGFLTLWVKQNKNTYWFPVQSYEELRNKALSLAEKGRDVYFGVGIRGQQLESYHKGSRKIIPRGTIKDIVAIPGFWMDIDIANSDAHAKEDLPPTHDAAISLLNEFPLKPSVLINSGYGLHGYWLFKEPWIFEDESERDDAAFMLKRFQATLQLSGEKKGWKLDTTSDLARVLRVPGTLNHKGKDPVGVTMLEKNDNRYDPEDFENYLVDATVVAATEKKESKKSSDDNGNGKAALIIDNCSFIKYCKQNAARLSEPEWYAMISNIARADDGREACHELSSGYPKYNQAETDNKVNHATGEGHPHTCHYIQVELGFKGCPEQGCEVAAPIGLVTSPAVKARLVVKTIPDRMKDKPEIVFEEEVIGALAILRQNYPHEYAQAKKTIKDLGGKKVSLNDLDRSVRHQQVKNQNLRLVEGSGDESAMGDMPEGLLYKPKKPPGWTVDQRGIYFQTEKGPQVASPVPVIITKRLRHLDTDGEKVELAFHRDKRWRYVVANRSTVFTRTRIPELADKGLPVTSESAKTLINYLSDLEFVNLSDIPLVRAISRLGWINSQEFLPGHSDAVLDVDGGTMHYAKAFQPAGTVKAWAEFISPLRGHSIPRLVLAAGFAAPLIEILNQRIFLLHLWGGSRGGKSAACKAALSIWGNPEEAQVSFHGTKVGLEQQAAFLCNLPIVIDEKQVLGGSRQDFLEGLVYMLGMGKGKARGSKAGGLQEFKTWKTLVVTNGEHPITTQSSATGLKTRCLELYARQAIPDEHYAQLLHTRLNILHGTAGPEFIKNIIDYPGDLQADYEAIVRKLQEWAPDLIGSHFGALAILGLADYLSSQFIFGLDEDQALDETLHMFGSIIKMMETSNEAEESYRAMMYLRSWIAQHEAKFHDGANERYGWIEKLYADVGETVYIYPTAFSKAMTEGGFNEKRILQDFADADWIEASMEGGKKRYTVKRRKDNSTKRVIEVRPVMIDDDKNDSDAPVDI